MKWHISEEKMNEQKDKAAVRPAVHQQMHIGWWTGEKQRLFSDTSSCSNLFRNLRKPLFAVLNEGEICFADEGDLSFDLKQRPKNGYPLLGSAMPCDLTMLGDLSFCADHGLKYPYIGGSMAHGISSTEMAIEFGRHGMLGFVGSAGESPESVREAIIKMKSLSDPVPFGFNLIHSPNEKELEDKIVGMFLEQGVNLIEASAFLSMTLPLIKYRVAGIKLDAEGRIYTPNKIIAKVSRVEVASKFFAPPPEKYLKKLVETGFITESQARLARKIPVAQDLTSEADSGGHTDNRPAVSLHPTMVALKNRMQKEYGYHIPLRVGFGGGNGTPASVAAAFAMGAAYVVTGTVNQACIESGTSSVAREMLANAGQADMAMAPAGDMFEMGVTVQVLKRGTMFAMRAQKLYDAYRKYNSLDEMPVNEKKIIENTIFQDSFENIWKQTSGFFTKRDPLQIERAERDPHHKMALLFRWYLGKSPRWAVNGNTSRKMDYQIWCGPAIGAFNEWAKNSFLEKAENRKVVTVAMNLLYGAALELRNTQLRNQGIITDEKISTFRPQPPEEMQNLF
jgi:PfaD family protein